MLKLIKSASVYAPEFLGKKDVLIADSKICKIDDKIEISGIELEIIQGENLILTPGFIDSHVHICGGGGEGGYKTRTPEIMLTDITLAGVTTIIGTLGTDDITRTMSNLVAKAKGLEEEGISTFVNTGSYHIPVKTLTGSIKSDLTLIDKVIGVGEIAISDHRSMQPTFEEFTKTVAEARVGGMLSGKAGTVNIHIGDSEKMIDLVERVIEETEIPSKHLVPTHMNRNPYLFAKSLEYLEKGGQVDYTSGSLPCFIEEGEVKCSSALAIIIKNKLNVDNVTWSSDGQGSMPMFDKKGTMIGLEVGKVTALLEELKDAVLNEKISLEVALKPLTSNPARIYKLQGKGQIKEGNAADIVLLEKGTLEINTVIAKGKIMVKNGKAIVKGTFENK